MYVTEHAATQMGARLSYLKQFSLFTLAPEGMSDEGKRVMLVGENYQIIHVCNVLSDLPTLRNVMEAEAKCSRPSPLTFTQWRKDKVRVEDKGAGPSHSQPGDCGL